MLILNIISDYSELKLLYYKKSIGLEIIEINDDKLLIYDPLLIYASLGQIQFRELLNKLYDTEYNPYCYVLNINKVLTIRAIYTWQLFTGCKKLAAFLNGQLIAMRVLTIYSAKKVKDINSLFTKSNKSWLHCNNEKQRYNGILLKIFNKQIEYSFQI